MSDIKYSSGFRPKMSIKRKFILSFSLAVLFPLVLLAVANTFIFSGQIKQESLNKVKITLSGARRIYYSQGNQLKNAFLVSSYNPYLINAITRRNIPFVSSLIKSYKNAFVFADYIGITDNRGNVLTSTSGVSGFKPSLGGMVFNVFSTGFPIVKTVLIRKIGLIKMGIKTTGNKPGMFLVTVVPFIRNNKVIGSIFGLVNLNNNNYLPEAIYNEYHLKTAVFASVFDRQVCLSTLKIPGNVFGIGSKLPDYILSEILSGNNFIKEINYNGKNIFAAFHPIKNLNGHVIGSIAVFVSNRAYLSLFRKTALYASIIILIGLIISFFISYFASKDTLNPIFAITEAIKNFTKGELDTRLIIKTNDEFERIGEGFTKMAETVRDREERMAKYNIFSDFLVGSLDFDEIISSVLDILEELLSLSSGVVYIYDEDGILIPDDTTGEFERHKGFLIPWKFYGIRKFVANKFAADEGVAGHCLQKRKTVWFRDIPEHAVIFKDQLLEQDAAGKAIDYGFCEVFPKDIVWVPLYVGDINIGVLMVSSLKGYHGDDIAFLEHAAKEFSVALDSAKLHKRLNKLSVTDELTGLYNRRKMDEILKREFDKAKRYKNSLSIIMLDVDYFKAINDDYGHMAGDVVLSGLGDILKQSVRNVDIVARYGGEEFVVILPQTDFQDAAAVAEKIKNIVGNHKFKQIDKKITVSIGLASLPDEHMESVDDILKIADNFLYEAKNNGRNRIIGSFAGKKIEIS